ncbi:MAG TPA: HEPN domain-containing protein [Spirochaetota bacterium]|nr:HEPN domain-containing protein [Spirochaetota bacterium]HPJ44357.1 HEPN domain-containing protein [Spirochaetota bacterium]
MSNQSDTAKLWFKKAQNDLKTGRDEFQTDEPATDTICFHMQQAVEKYLKGFLVYHGLEAEKTHNISRILNQCINLDSSFSVLADAGIEILTPYGTVIRYPDDFIFLILMKQQSLSVWRN